MKSTRDEASPMLMTTTLNVKPIFCGGDSDAGHVSVLPFPNEPRRLYSSSSSSFVFK